MVTTFALTTGVVGCAFYRTFANGPEDIPPPCETLIAPPAPKAAMLVKALIPREDGHQIDVAIFWSPQVAKSLGGAKAAQIPAAIVADANAIFAASACRPRLRLVASGVYWHDEAGVSLTDLHNFTADSSTSLVRAKYGADLCQLVTLNTGGPAGTAYISGYTSVVKQQYAISFHSAAHEIAHDFGADHDKAHATYSPLPYGFGFHSTNYGDLLDESGKTRLAVLSNGARFTYRAPLTGTAITLGALGTADVARLIDQTSATVANLMPQVVK